MTTVKEFGETAKSLARNPLGIIALFIVLIYGFASLVVGASDKLQSRERYLIVLFMTIFPVVVLGVFGWLVAYHHEKLYAPRDFKSDESFLKGLGQRRDGRPALLQLDSQIESKIREVLGSEELQARLGDKANVRKGLMEVAEQITEGIRNTSFITVDARKLTGDDNDVYELPAGAFSTLNELTDEIYFSIDRYIHPFEYGYSWVLRRAEDNSIVKNARMITNTEPGIPISDERSLEEVGIYPGMVLEVTRP